MPKGDALAAVRSGVPLPWTATAAGEDDLDLRQLELVGNAVKHGFYARLTGRVRISFAFASGGARLTVADDGWGLCHRAGSEESLDLVRALVAPLGGTLSLRPGAVGGLTAEVVLSTAAEADASRLAL